MTIARILGRGHVRVAAVITALCLAAGCDNPLAEEFGEPDEQTRRELAQCGTDKPADGLAAPPGSYVDQGLTINYPRLRHDGRYIDKILADPRRFEQVYVDAAAGNVTARWSVCLFEAASRDAARRGANKLAGLRCQTIARCTFEYGALSYSDTTASGVRVLTLIADEFEAEARRLQLTQEIVGHALALFVSTRVLSARAGTATTVSRPVGPRPTATVSRHTGQQGARRPAVRELTEAELARVRGGSSARRGPAVGAVKAASKPAYRPFTRANFRHNLAQRTGGIPDNAQAHHVLPVKFEVQCRKAGVNIHEPKFGTWWKRRAHQKKARAYNDDWDNFFRNANPTSEEILQFGRTIAGKYGLTIGF